MSLIGNFEKKKPKSSLILWAYIIWWKFIAISSLSIFRIFSNRHSCFRLIKQEDRKIFFLWKFKSFCKNRDNFYEFDLISSKMMWIDLLSALRTFLVHKIYFQSLSEPNKGRFFMSTQSTPKWHFLSPIIHSSGFYVMIWTIWSHSYKKKFNFSLSHTTKEIFEKFIKLFSLISKFSEKNSKVFS